MEITNKKQKCLKCEKLLDVYGDHAHTCATGNGRYRRHDVIKEHIHKELKKLNLDPELEPKNLFDDSNKRPADVMVDKLFHGENSWIDIGIRHVNYEVMDIKKGNNNILEYEKSKIKKYENFIDKNQKYKNSKYRPFSLQTDGVITKSTKEIITKIIQLKKEKSEEDISILTGRFKSNLIALLMKLNAKNILQHYRIN